MFDEHNLRRALRGIGILSASDLFNELSAVYSAADRHYHNRDHIADCLMHFQSVRDPAEHPDEVEVAL